MELEELLLVGIPVLLMALKLALVSTAAILVVRAVGNPPRSGRERGNRMSV